MVKIAVLYGHPTDSGAFEEYYANNHLPLVYKIPNFQRFEAAKVVATPDGSELPYYRIAELYFENMDQLQSSMGSQEGQAATEDFQNFVTGELTIFISEVDA
jgi:uncharacterized protein (TIGR02118 family)